MDKALIDRRVNSTIEAVSSSIKEGSITWKIEENKNNPEILFGLLTGAILIWLSLRKSEKI